MTPLVFKYPDMFSLSISQFLNKYLLSTVSQNYTHILDSLYAKQLLFVCEQDEF